MDRVSTIWHISISVVEVSGRPFAAFRALGQSNIKNNKLRLDWVLASDVTAHEENVEFRERGYFPEKITGQPAKIERIIKMALKKLLMTASAAVFGTLMSTSAMAVPVPYSAPVISGGIGLGFGTFIGTWHVDNSLGNTGDMPDPQSGGGNAADVGAAINAQYNPDLFDINEFRLAGGTGTYVTNGPGDGFRVDSIANPYTAKWTYDGFPAGPGSPGMAPVDLYVAVKYNNYVSVFRYDLVDPDLDNDGFSNDDNVFGYFSSDFRTILLNTALANGVPYSSADTDAELAALAATYTARNYDGFYNGFSGGCSLSGLNEFSIDCMAYNIHGTLDPFGVSHVVAYWPPVGESVPEPASLTLLGAGLMGLTYLARRRTRSADA